jgi:phage terminase large subunit-like protein
MAGGNPSKLKPCTPENARERQLKSAEKRKENNAKKKLMSQIYAEFLEKEYNVRQGDKERKLTGAELVNECMKKIIARGDSSSVSLMTEIRKAMEGDKVNLEGSVKAEMQTTEERLKIFDELIGEK